MKYLFIMPLALLLSISLMPSLAQVSTDKNMPKDYTVIPPSPEVSSLMKYTEIPVSYFNGLPQIDIPIYDLKAGRLSVPISLNYHGGGIKVNEVPGEAGLGWALIAGGCISRTVYGHPDDIVNSNDTRGLFRASQNDINLRTHIMNKIADYDPADHYPSSDNLEKILNWGYDYMCGHSDMANDVYQINCMGISGTFIYNDSKDMVLSSGSGISVSPSRVSTSVPSEYIITDVNGTKYFFGKQEFTRYEYSFGDPYNDQRRDSIRYVSAWHLTKVKNIENDSILFHYRTKGYKSVNYGGSQTYYTINNIEYAHFISPFVSSSGIVNYYPESLVSVESKSAIVKFEYDNTNDHITSINVCLNNESQDIVKRYVLFYDHFFTGQGTQGKLMLESVREYSSDKSNYRDMYNFGYYADNYLPEGHQDQDFCGYYNDAGNTCLVPSVGDIYGCGANRDVNLEACLYGSLTSITYPTGGKTLFQWEANDYSYLGNASINKTSNTTLQKTEVDTLVGLIPVSVRKLIIDNYVISDKHTVSIDLSKYFAINPDSYYEKGYTSRHYADLNDVFPRVVFINKTKNNEIKPYNIFYIDEYTQKNGIIPVALEPGTYKIELQYPTEIDNPDEYFLGYFNQPAADWGKIYITKKTLIISSDSKTKDYWGGLRIGSILSVANAECDTIVKEYIYAPEGDPFRSTGVISEYPYYLSSYYLVTESVDWPGIANSFVRGAASSGLYKTPVGGQRVEYKSVLERYSFLDRNYPVSYLKNLTVEYNYSSQFLWDCRDYNVDDEFRDMQPRGAQMWTSKAHLRGNLLNKKVRNSGGGIIYTETNYNYNIYEDPDKSIFTTDLFRISDFTHGPTPYIYDYSIGKYTLIPYTKTKRSEETIEYDGSNKQTSKVSYTYFYNSYTHNKDYSLVRSKIVVNPNGERRETFYTYLKYEDQYLNLPETEITVMDGIILSARRMEYDMYNRKLRVVYTIPNRGISSSGYSLGSNKGTSEALRAIINRKEYQYEYDGLGNLVQISYNGEVLASYLWGYKGTYPILEVKGVKYGYLIDELRILGINSTEQLSDINDTSRINSILTHMRDKFSGYEVTSMTYHWLIGVSTATDSRGVTTHFTFDDFGRLSDVKDYNGYFIRKYDYHYAEPE